MIAGGIDLGGTKIEAQVYGADWALADRQRVPTPQDYDTLVAAVAGLVGWIGTRAGASVPVGIAAAGLVNPATGLALTANLPATGHPFPAEIEAASGRRVTYVNDCRALTLSEAVFGAGRGASPVVGLIIGTGIGGGVAVDGRLLAGATAVGGEFGHMSAPARLVAEHGLPIVRCGCGRMGCAETYIAGPGLVRLAKTLTGRDLTPPEIAAGRAGDPALTRVWRIWCDLVAETLLSLTMTVDPEVIVLGGGLSQAEGLIGDLTAALWRVQLSGFGLPRIVLADGGEASGGRGAAYAAWLEQSATREAAQ